jgi:hypothetical protein
MGSNLGLTKICDLAVTPGLLDAVVGLLVAFSMQLNCCCMGLLLLLLLRPLQQQQLA